MKKPTKSIITSSLLAVAFGALSVGSTFALFTSQSQTEISVGSGIVNVESKATLVSYQSTVEGETVYPITGNSYSNTRVGNSFGLDGNIVTIDKMVPGDVLTLKLSAVNKSNVKTKTRFMISHATVGTKGDLFPALEFTFSAGSLNATDLFRWQENDAVADSALEEGVALYGEDGLEITIAFPDGDDGEILFGSENHDNQYQDCACSIAFGLEAVQGNAATSPIDEINAYLSAEMLFEGQNKTMYEAVEDMREIGYGILNLNVLNYNNVNYVYSLDADQFVAETSVTENHYRYFKVYSAMPGSQTFSIYAANDWANADVTLNGVGFDAGEAVGIASVSYAGLGQENARSNVIRTNSLATAVTVNAPYDTVKHYGDAASVNIQAVAGNSYHEFGNVAFTEISSGRIVLEEGSNTVQIHLNAKDDNSFAAITIANNGLSAEELPSKITRDQINVQNEKELVVTVRDLVNETVEPVYAYPYSYIEQEQTIPAGTTEKTTVQNADVETPLGLKVIDSNNHDGEKALAPAAKTEEKAATVTQLTFVENNTTGKVYHDVESAIREIAINDELEIVKDSVVDKMVVIRQDAITDYRIKIVVAEGKTLSFKDEGQIVFDVTSGSCRLELNGTGTIRAYNNIPMFKSGNGYIETISTYHQGELNAQQNEVIESNNVTVIGGKFSDCKVKFESGHYDTLIANVVNMEYSIINGGTFVTKPEGVTLKSNCEWIQNSTTGYWEIGEAIPDNAIFKLIPNDPTIESIYILENGLDKIQEEPYTNCGYTLELLDDKEIYIENGSTRYQYTVFFTGASNKVLDLKGHTLTITCGDTGSEYIFGNDEDSNISIISSSSGGTIQYGTKYESPYVFNAILFNSSYYGNTSIQSSVSLIRIDNNAKNII